MKHQFVQESCLYPTRAPEFMEIYVKGDTNVNIDQLATNHIIADELQQFYVCLRKLSNLNARLF